MRIKFLKMHGLGNDFIVLDTRTQEVPLSKEGIRKLCSRRFGVGCDQFITLSQPTNESATVRMRIFNADGQEVEACGNASRCVSWLMAQDGVQTPVLETIPGLLETKVNPDNTVQVNMGPAQFEWETIPLSAPLDASSLNITFETIVDPIAVNVGNPHIVFFVKDLNTVDVERLGSSLSHHGLFPEGTNVEVAWVKDFNTIVTKVWERGVGVTLACGSGACAVAAAAHRKGLAGDSVDVHLEGGQLHIQSLSKGDILMTGPVDLVFEGHFESSLIA